MNDRDYGSAVPGRRKAGLLVVAFLLVFLLGIIVAIYAVRHSRQVAGAVLPTDPIIASTGPTMPAAAAPVMLAPAPIPVAAGNAELADELGGRVAAVESRLGEIEAEAQEASGDADRAEALLVVFAARRALDRGRPLGYLEGLLRDRFGASDAPSVALVIAAAQRPVTLAGLQDGLAALTPELAARAGSQGWWQSTKSEFANLFVVRRADAPSAVPADRIARAARALDQGQVDAAAAEVARMPGAAQASPWLGAARRYMLARGALDRLETVALLKPARATTAAKPG